MIPIIFGYPLHFWIGILLFILIIFQIVVAKKILPIPFKWHRITGYLILILAAIHALIATGIYSRLF